MWKTTAEPSKQNKAVRVVPSVRVLGATARTASGQQRVFEGAAVLVGRAAGEGGLQFPDDDRVSRRHAILRFDPSSRSARIEDLSSTGTFVQGRKVVNEALAEGDVVRVGDSFFLFRFEPEGVPELSAEESASELIGPSLALRTLRRSLSLVGKSGATVVILGESGTGKELAARALHEKSGRAGPFVAVNCGAIPETLVESQFFGHVAGAFTGAKTEARGWFRAAEGGTLFLDEIGELPLLLQPKLLRAVEERAVVPVGATQPVRCDVRIVAATNRDLSDREQFRADLFARISEFVLEIPPLRARREDVLPILWRLLGPVEAELDPDLVSALLLYDYPHNARDLRRIATQLSVRGAEQALWDASLLDRALRDVTTSPAPARESEPAPEDDGAELKGRVPTRDELETLLRVHRGVVAEIAKDTGRSRKQVYRWLSDYGFSLEDFRSS
jgi:transcriptional regulator with PAS, ATPase and Fis domain